MGSWDEVLLGQHLLGAAVALWRGFWLPGSPLREYHSAQVRAESAGGEAPPRAKGFAGLREGFGNPWEPGAEADWRASTELSEPRSPPRKADTAIAALQGVQALRQAEICRGTDEFWPELYCSGAILPGSCQNSREMQMSMKGEVHFLPELVPRVFNHQLRDAGLQRQALEMDRPWFESQLCPFLGCGPGKNYLT